METIAPILPVLFVGGLVALVVVTTRSRRRRERVALAAQWDWMLREREARRPTGVRMLQVESVYQRARRGSKARVRWCDSGAVQDAWFQGWHAPPGAFVLAVGQTGWGPHNQIRNVLYVGPGQVYGWAPAAASVAWQRLQATA
ncbi:hypothetical protein [Kitasatospora sp. NPDC088346]|uniref:hypothetical protein n=1 Tax=Kitasatospora sp. NPDC088346 TaxID=3364073 RepID=UPI003824B5D8